MRSTFEFCIPTTGTKVPASPERFHEIKYDGYRLRLERNGDRVRLIFRCSHWIAVRTDHWPGEMRLSDIEDRYVCSACGRREIRPDFPPAKTGTGG